MIRSTNPALGSSTFMNAPRAIGSDSDVMTLQGTVNKSAILLLIVLLPAAFVWNQFFSGNTAIVVPMMYGGLFGGLILALITTFKKTWAPVTAPIYAGLEGLALGGISSFFEAKFPGIVIQATFLTFGVFGALLFAYKTRIIRATENFKLGVSAAVGGIMIVYVVGWIMSMFGSQIPYIHESGMIGIGFSVFVVIVASLSLVLNFDFIEEGAKRGAPKYMEWYSAFGLLVTLVWLYLEILILLSKLQGRD